MRYTALLAPFLVLLGLVNARSSTGDRVLVVLESSVDKNDYSKFWSSLTNRGFELTFKSPKDDAALVKFGETQYDHLIHFAPSSKSFSAALSPKAVLESQLLGLNTLYLLSSDLSEINREHFREYDLEFTDSSSTLIDAFSHPISESASTVLLPSVSSIGHNSAIFSPSTISGGPIVYPSGTVHYAGLNPYLIDVLHGSKTSYVGQDKVMSGDEAEVEKTVGASKSRDGVVSGKKASLVTALQTRDNVRVGFVGSGAALSDKYWDVKVDTLNGKSVETGNAAFISDFSKWVFQETGVVKIISSTHFRANESEPRNLYTKKDDITYSITLAQYYTTSNGTSSWGPISLSDMQLEFTMLDPHIRTSLTEDKETTAEFGTVYKARFRAPDRHGVFKFVVEYWRPGWSYIQSSTQASIVPLRHDEYPRFITGAWPYYLGAVSTSITFLFFCALWVSLGENDKDRKGKKKAE